MSRDEHVEHNGSGYVDETFDGVVKHEYNRAKRANEDYKYGKMRDEIKEILDSSGYVLEGPISLISLESGIKRRIY